jgi:hypothetical protein
LPGNSQKKFSDLQMLLILKESLVLLLKDTDFDPAGLG